MYVHYFFLAMSLLLSVQGRNRRVVVDLDSTTLLVLIIGERQVPATFAVRRREPQSHEMSAGERRSVVLVRSSGVKDVCIGQELNVADLENHVQSKSLAGLLEDGGCMLLLGRKSGDDALVGETLERANVVRIPLGVKTSVWTRLHVEDGRLDPLFLTNGCLPLAVEVPDRLCEEFRNIWVLLLKSIPYVVNGDKVRLAALERTCDAEKTNNVAVVGVEVLTSTCSVDTDLVNLGGVLANVLDMSENVAATVLRDKVAKVGAEAHVCSGRLVVAPLLYWEALEEDEALAIEKLVPECIQRRGHVGERELLLLLCQDFTQRHIRTKDKRTFVMPVRGVLDAIKSSAALLISATSSSLKTCVHVSGLFLYSEASHTVGPLISLGNSE